MQNTVSIKLDKSSVGKLDALLLGEGFKKIPVKTEYEADRYQSVNKTAVLYSSGKFVLQGKELGELETKINRLAGIAGGENDHDSENAMGWSPRVGADEVGKGDYFGPMVVSACFVNETIQKELRKIGVADSKKLSDIQILDYFSEIHKICDYEVGVVNPKMYNDQYKEVKNVSILLAKAHAKTIDTLLKRLEKDNVVIEKVVVDQFSKSKARLTNELTDRTKEYKFEQFHKGESDISVAAASIIARAYFLREWEEMCQLYDFEFPKGASNVINPARIFIDIHGEDKLPEVAKVSFKTTEKVLSSSELF